MSLENESNIPKLHEDELRKKWHISKKINIKQMSDGYHLIGFDGVDYARIQGGVLVPGGIEEEDPIKNTGIVPKYSAEEVSEVRLSPEDFYFVVITHPKDADEPKQIHTHIGKVGRDDAQMILPNIQNKCLDTTVDMIRRYFPRWRECICSEKFTKEPYINRLIIGEEPYEWESASSEMNYVVLEMTRILGTKDDHEYCPSGEKPTIFKTNPKDVYTAILWMAAKNPRDRFIDTISRIEWDGVNRIDDFYKGLGGKTNLDSKEEDEYLSHVARATFLTPIQRHLQREPVSIPFIPLFIGDQHVGKSDICKMIGLMSWHTEYSQSFKTVEELYYNTQGAVFVELAEGVAFRKTGAEGMKALADTAKALFRSKYDKFTSMKTIGSTFIITTNDESLLTDDTGNRRYFPIRFDPDFAKRTTMSYGMDQFAPKPSYEVYQLWAEALDMYQNRGIRWATGMLNPEGRGFKPIYTQVQKTAVYKEPWEVALMEWLDTNYPKKGSLVTNVQIKEFLSSYDKNGDGKNLGLTSDQIDSNMKRLGHSTAKFGLKKIRDITKKIKSPSGEPSVKKYTEYIRTDDAVFDVDIATTEPTTMDDYYADDNFAEDFHYGKRL